jgi:biotin operon repressor
VATAQTAPAASDWKAVEQAVGRSGQLQGDGAYKFGLPRGDLKVTVDGVQVKPTLALGSWVAFSSPGQDAMLMGDLVLPEDEVSPVMLALQENGLQITALHNHVLHETPRVMYMHIAGHGDAVKLAGSVKQVIALTKTPAPTQPPTTPPALDLDTAAIDQTLGHRGKVNGGVYQVGVPRAEKITDAGMPVPASMGLATALNFQPTGTGKAAITGDFVLLASEVNPVIKALRQNGIQVTAVHNHMLQEEPRLFFLHFWANDDAVKLAKGLRAALENTNSAK